jgi:hypothetical protein
MLRIGDFSSAALTGGYVRLGKSASGELVTYGKSIFGKIAAWVKAKLHPGTAMEANRQVMQSFVKALKDRYGDGCVLGKVDLSGSKPLSARTIRRIIDLNEKQEATIRQFNKATACYVAEGNFYNYVDIIRLEMNIPLPTEVLANLDHTNLSMHIMNKIKHMQGNPPKVITKKEAEAVAKEEIRKFLTAKNNIFIYIDSNQNLSEEDKAILKEMVISFENIASPEHLDRLWNMKEQIINFINLIKSNPPASIRHVTTALEALAQEIAIKLTEAGESLRAKGKLIEGSEFRDFRAEVIQLAIKIGHLNRNEIENIYEFLSSGDALKLRGSLEAIESNPNSTNEDQILATYMHKLFEDMIPILGRLLGKTDNEIRQSRDRNSEVRDMRDIPEEIALGLRDRGIDVYYSGDLASVLESRTGYVSLLQYASSAHNEENVLFWKEVERFKTLTGKEQEKAAREIVAKYIFNPSAESGSSFTTQGPGGDDSYTPINIDEKTRSEIMKKIKEGKIDSSLFDTAQKHVFDLIGTNIFQEWRQHT